MKEEFATYNQSLALKELGFDEPCLGYYVLKDYQLYYDTIIDRKDNIFRNNTTFNLYNDIKKKIAAPLKQQVFRWFRERHNLHIGICHAVNNKFDCWTNAGHLLYGGEYCDFDSYDEAESACIDKLIEMVKNK